MKSFLFSRLGRWFNLPAGVLIALLQRTPIVRIAMGEDEQALASSAGAVLRSALAAVAGLGALDTLAGATTITASPAQPLTVTAGQSTAVGFVVTGTQNPASSWSISVIPAGMNFQGFTTPGTYNVETLNGSAVLSGAPTVAGTYHIVVVAYESANGQGLATSPLTYTLVVNPSNNPTFTTQPAAATVTPGSSAAFTVIASKATSYQWQLNSQNVTQANAAGVTTPTLFLTNTTAANAGSYTCIATNASGSTTSAAASLQLVATTTPGHLVNLSILSDIAGTLTMGFVNGGAGTSGSESLLIRAVGPSLAGAPFNIAGVLPDPTLTLVQQNDHATLATNAGWGTPASNATAVMAADAATGAFALTNQASLDSALVQLLPSVTGGYSAVVAGQSGDGGNAITEVYDANSSYTATSTRLVNLSCITSIPAGGSLDVGFVLGGSTAKTLLVRVSGPTLGALGYANTMADPQLVVTPQSNGSEVVAADSGWNGNAVISSVAASVGAFAFTSPTSKDSAVVLTLAPGVPYTAQVNSASGGGGNVLVEIYEVP